MKIGRKFLSVALAATLAVTALTGCGGSSSGGGSDSAGTNNTGNATTASSNASSGSAGGEAAATGEFTLPLTDEKETISVWMVNEATAMSLNEGDYNNNPFFKELEERTNVHIDWQVPASGTESEQFRLLFTSGDLPDLMYYSDQNISYADGLDAAVDDGYFMDLTDLLPKYAPHYLEAVAKASETVQKAAKTPEGRYVQIHAILQTQQPDWYGFVVRQDWLDDLGLSTPKTFDEWETMLTKFKEEKGATAPLNVNSVFLWGLGAGMGVHNLTDFYQEDGVVKQAIVDEPAKTKEFLTMLNRWYANGLLDPDFASESNYFGNSVLVTTDKSGVTLTMYTIPSSTFLPSMTDEDAAFSALPYPVVNEGDVRKSGYVVSETNASWVISADCKNPELILKWIDYFYTEEGARFANYGKEGECYTLEDGKAVFTDMIKNNPDGLSYDAAMRIYTWEPSWPGVYYDWERELQFVPEQDYAMCPIWDDFDHEATQYPSYATMTTDENAEYSDIFSDLQTYINENLLSFVTGSKDLSEFDGFVSTVESMNMARVKELKQAALDRFNGVQ